MEQTYKSYLTAALSYSAVVSALYLFGYWGAFDINVLEFVTLSDLLKLAIYPLLLALAFILIGLIQGQLFWGGILPVGGGADSPVGRLGRKYWRVLLYIISGIALFVALMATFPQKWLIVAFLLAILGTPLGYVELFIRWIPHPSVRSTILFQAVLLAGMAFAFGRINADSAQRGLAPLVVDIQRSGISMQERPNLPVAYIGRIGDYFALYETSTSHIVILSGKKVDTLHLIKNPKRN